MGITAVNVAVKMLMPWLNIYGTTQRQVSVLWDVIKCTYISLVGKQQLMWLSCHIGVVPNAPATWQQTNILLQHGRTSHIHMEVTTFLGRQTPTDGSARVIHYLVSTNLQIWPPQPYCAGLCERWSLCSTNACNPEQLEGLNNNSYCKKMNSLHYKITAQSWRLPLYV